MSDYELRNAKEWDAASSVRLSSRLSEELDDGFTTVQPAKVKRQNQAQLGHSTNVPNHTAFNRPSNAHATRPTQIDGYSNGRAAPNRGRDGAGQRGNFHNDHRGEKPANRGAPPNRASTQRAKPMSAAELASQRGEPATGNFSFAIPRKVCNRHLQNVSKTLRAELGGISRRTATHIAESSADVYSVLIWGDEAQVRQATLQLEELSRKTQPDKWAKNPAFDGRRENRRDLKAHEVEQATRVQLFAQSQEYPFEYSFIWPESELSLQHVLDTHDKPGGAFGLLRRDHQCSIRCDLTNSTILLQGMQERDVISAGRKLEGVARQMITEMSTYIKISLVGAPTAEVQKAFVSMDQKIDLKTTLYELPFQLQGKTSTFAVNTPKLWIHQSPIDDEVKAKVEKSAARLSRFNRRSILAGLERSLTNLHYVQKAVRMQVDFGELAFLRYLAPQFGFQHHSFESFRKTISKDRTDLLLQAMPPHVQMSEIIKRLRKHPALRHSDEAYVIIFDFCRLESSEVLRHEQEFGESSKKDEMEIKRRSWVRIGDDSDRRSPLTVSVLDFESLDWQLKLRAYDNIDPRHMPKEYLDFEFGVGMPPVSTTVGMEGPSVQRASWPRSYALPLVRVINKPVIKFRLGDTDHILEIAREDIYETDPFQSSSPKPESKWTASFYYQQWANILGEFAYNKHGERTTWAPSLSTFFPEPDGSEAQLGKKRKGPRIFLREIEEMKQILWEVTRPSAGGEEAGDGVARSVRVGVLEGAEEGNLRLAD